MKGEQSMRELVAELETMKAPYNVKRFLSSGSYGAVCAGEESGSHNPVAIKRVFTTVSDGHTVNILADSFLCKRVLREVRLLCHFNHPNILGLRDMLLDLKPGNPPAQTAKHKMYLVTELMKTDLAQVVSDRRIDMTPEHIRFFMYQVFLGLRVLHEAGVVHRDLHPGNLLLSADNDIKICDFNLAREDTKADDKTHYVTHRWYRAPELVMQWKGFNKQVDMWSAGCVMGEMFKRSPLFQGTTFYNQLNKIIDVIGTPAEEDVQMFSSPSAREYLRTSLSAVTPKAWSTIVPTADAQAVDLLSKLLVFNPNQRLTAEQALRHPYFADLFDERDLHEWLSPPFHFDENINEVPGMHAMLAEDYQRMQLVRQQREAQGDAAGRAASGAVLSPVPPNVGLDVDEGHMPRTGSFVWE